MEAVDGHVGDADEPVEVDAVLLSQVFLVGRLELLLRGRQVHSGRVVHEIQPERAGSVPVVVDPVSPLVQHAEGGDAPPEDLVAPLSIDVVLEVAGEGGDDVHLVVRQELAEVALLRLQEDGQVAAVDDVEAEFPALGDPVPEFLVQLWGAPRQVDDLDGRGVPDDLQTAVRRLPTHHLLPRGGRVHVAMRARLVAVQADVGLKDQAALSSHPLPRFDHFGHKVGVRKPVELDDFLFPLLDGVGYQPVGFHLLHGLGNQ